MGNYINYIYLTICDSTLNRFGLSYYTTHAQYCKGLYRSINSGGLSITQKIDLDAFHNDLDRVFSLGVDECSKHIVSFLALDVEEIRRFEKLIQIERYLYKNSNIKG